jgi:hypothetical protein
VFRMEGFVLGGVLVMGIGLLSMPVGFNMSGIVSGQRLAFVRQLEM